MKILLIVSAFNSLTQKIFCYLSESGYEVSVEFAINDEIMKEACKLFKPDIILCPYLLKKIPKEIYENIKTFIIHPGPFGDRGAFALDNAILNKEKRWGVEIIEADEEFDAGDIWAYSEFKMPKNKKGYIYRNQIANEALNLTKELLEKLKSNFKPLKNPKYPFHEKITQKRREIDWQKDSDEEIKRKIDASDNFPGVRDTFFGIEVYLFGAHIESNSLEKIEAKPKEIIAKRDGAVLVKTKEGAVWIERMTPIENGIRGIKLPSTYVLKDKIKGVKERRIPLYVNRELQTFKEITFSKIENVGFLDFEFYNGAMDSKRCIRLKYAIETLKEEVDILVLTGGENFFSNGIDLCILEDSKKKGEDGWSNINAMNNLIKEIIFSEDIITISVFRANAGAGGVFLALSADIVFAKKGVVLNPHYKTLGLSGSEYHTYTFFRRVGEKKALEILNKALPISSSFAKKIKMVDYLYEDFKEVENFALRLAEDEERYYEILDLKRERLQRERKLINSCLEKELEVMYPEFWDKNSPFHKLRHDFVYKVCPVKTPLRLAVPSRKNNA